MHSRAGVLVCACVLASLGAALWLTREAPREVVEQREQKKALAAQRLDGAAWRASLTYAPIAELGDGALESSLVSHMQAAPGEGLVTDAMKQTLAEDLAQQLVARAGGPDAYLEYVDSAPRRWLGADDEREWYLIGCYEQGTMSPDISDRSDPRAHLETIVRKAYASSKPNALAVNDDACAIAFYRAASPEQAFVAGYELLPEGFLDRAFTGSGHNAIRTHWPPMTADELLRRDRSVLCALAVQTVQTEDESSYAWITRWSWDPDARRWYCEDVSRNGDRGHTMFY